MELIKEGTKLDSLVKEISSTVALFGSVTSSGFFLSNSFKAESLLESSFCMYGALISGWTLFKIEEYFNSPILEKEKFIYSTCKTDN